jgi:tRNA threonylcarbamoyladenosine biosynthesis protein TsaB
MVILAVETVTRCGSLAWHDARSSRATAGASERAHGERLPGDITDWLAESGHTLADVDLFAVVSGPGSFTGLRVGIATVQGLALAARKPALGVPTLEALADGWRRHDPAPALVVACLDGQRADVFFAAWLVDGSSAIARTAAVIPPAVGLAREAADQVSRLRGQASVIVVGSGGLKYPEPLTQLGDVRIVACPVPLAAAAAALAAERTAEAGVPHALRPVYLRRPDAEIARERQRT